MIPKSVRLFVLILILFFMVCSFASNSWAVDPIILGRIELPDSSPAGLAIDGSHFWFVDADSDRIYEVDQTGGVVSSFASPGASPKGLAFDGAYLWLSESETNRIYRLDSSGTIVSSFETPGNYPRGLCFDGQYLWHVDSQKQKLYKFDTSGTLLNQADLSIGSPYGLAFDGTNFWVSDYDAEKIFCVSPSGTVLRSFNSPSTTPYGLAHDGTCLWSISRWGDTLYKVGTDADIMNTSHLVSTRWGQRDDYARFTPDNYRAGCWSTALSQMLYYYRLAPFGSVGYDTTTGYSLNENFDAYTFDWKLFVDEFTAAASETSINEVARYVYYTAVVIQKDFNTGMYVLSNSGRIEALESHYDCDAAIYSLSDSSMDQFKQMITDELADCRPVMLYLDNPEIGHAVVIDAAKTVGSNFYVHVNMGHQGRDNGWYDFDEPMLGIYEVNKILTVNPTKYDTATSGLCHEGQDNTPAFDCALGKEAGYAYLSSDFKLYLPDISFNTGASSLPVWADFKLASGAPGVYFELVAYGQGNLGQKEDMAILSRTLSLEVPKAYWCTGNGSYVTLWIKLAFAPGFAKPTFKVEEYGFN